MSLDAITADSVSERIDQARAEWILRTVLESNLLPDHASSFLVHDLERMKQRLGEFKHAFPPSTRHSLAIKANPLVEVLKVAVGEGFGLEAASIEEVELAIAAGCPHDRIVFDSPAKTVREIERGLRCGVIINVDNFIELSRVDEAIRMTGSNSAIGLRINPEVGSGSIAHTSVGSVGSKFGLSISEQRDQIIQAYATHPWLIGIHTHVGSQGCGLTLLCEAVSKVDRLRRDIESEVGRPISIFNIGGGLPAAYLARDNPPTPAEYVDQLRQSAPGLFQGDTTLMTEFGRSIQANCGLAFSRVETVRQLPNSHKLAVIHFGADFLLRPVYRGEDWKHEFFVFDRQGRSSSGHEEPVTIAGPLCFSGDIVANQISIPSVKENDWIAIRDCGAYTLSMWSRHCNRAIPAVLGFDQGRLSMLRHSETAADIVQLWSSGSD
ncbi:Diaminopimelate decarboxylase [Stieleria maiorica]|uniref:Diaminopimelate decarboxylase n=1 Tax=Stieleria maiorica TaxID=2795974 RepID=A0A5B9MC34_9BACT|nr:diaminopimelate decarboxylase [Stieleria maiorica]QEF98772.1 Diaminopimelate decarboxylase [Stieleria maiorica]